MKFNKKLHEKTNRRIELEARRAAGRRKSGKKAEEKTQGKETAGDLVSLANVNAGSPESYIVLPAGNYGKRDFPELYVAMNRISYADERVQGAVDKLYPNKRFSDNDQGFLGSINHSDALEINRAIGAFTLPVLLGREFLRLLKSGIEDNIDVLNGTRQKISEGVLAQVYEDITKVRFPWRGEWFADKFSKKGRKTEVTTYVFDGNQLRETTESIKGYLTSQKTPGISLDAWLTEATEHGLPKRNCSDGDLWYWPPTGKRVARFVAYSSWANLDCGRIPTVSVASLGVREARAKI